MKCLIWLIAVLPVAALCVGCTKSSEPAPSAESTAAAPADGSETPGHSHGTGPNGGVVFDLGAYHAEFVVSHPTQECKIILLGADEKTPSPATATELVLVTKETKTADGIAVAPMTIVLTPADAADGKASTFVGTDPGIANVADFAGTVSGDIDRKPSQGEFKE